MLQRSAVSLNAMAFDAALGLGRLVVEQGLHLRRLIVDTVGDPERYRRFLHDGLGGRVDVLVEKKADANFPVVSAASIAAKCCRDESVRPDALQASSMQASVALRGSTGSGYPSDPACKAWMADNLHPVFGWPSVVRFSWANAKDMLKKEAVEVDFGEEEDDDDGARAGWSASSSSGGAPISGFFTPIAAAPGAATRKPCTSLREVGCAPALSLFA